MAERNAATLPERRIEFCIGINLGDVIAEGEDIFGDGVNDRRTAGSPCRTRRDLCEPRSARPSPRQARLHLGGSRGAAGQEHCPASARIRVRDTAARQSPASQTSPTLSLPDKPSIAVLPFANMSGDPEQEYFADGMVEEMITALSRIRWLFVIARNSTFTYKGQALT